MGKAIEAIALERGHTITAKFDSKTDLHTIDRTQVDVAIEFTRPELAVKHIELCVSKNIPIVVGTTAWFNDLPKVTQLVKQKNGSLLHASNFSIGVNLFFDLNKKMAKLFAPYKEYSAEIQEIHHTEKLDAPSGTAITAAQELIANNENYSSWKLVEEADGLSLGELPIIAERLPDVPGTHIISYRSEIDTIQLIHEANNRKGFATGAVVAAEYLFNKTGVFTMRDVLNL
jgi:4-hydroxy-tetrahydrodipicolinate reductase